MFGHDLELSLTFATTFAQLLPVTQRHQAVHVDPAFEPIVHPVEQRAAVNVKHRVPRGVTAHRVDAGDLHRAAPDVEKAELDIILEALTGSEWNRGARRRRGDIPGLGNVLCS